MCEEYPVFMLNVKVGQIRLEKDGLYCRYAGKIKTEVDGIYRIYAFTDLGKINLGVCQPENGSWVTRGRIPLQHLCGDNIHFLVNPDEIVDEYFWKVETGASFASLDALDQCRFAVRNGQSGLIQGVH